MAIGLLLWGPTELGVGDAPELSPWMAAAPYPRHLPPTLCNETSDDMEPRDLVFEWVEPGDLDEEDFRLLTGGNREVVAFHWSESTGELSFDTTAPTGVFNDLLASSPASAGSPPMCGSR